MDSIIDYFLSYKPWVSILLILAVAIIWRKLMRYLEKKLISKQEQADKRASMHLTLSVVKYIVAVIIFVMILQVNDIDVPGIVAGLGIVGIVVGFALQDILKDLIMGASIVWDGFFSVGDVVRYKQYEGTIMSFNFKTTKIRDINTGALVTVSNRNISEAEILSNWCDLDVPLPYDIETSDARAAVEEMRSRIEAADTVASCEMLGTQGFEASFIAYRLRAHCENPADRNDVRRLMAGIVQDVTDERGIDIPCTRVDVSMK